MEGFAAVVRGVVMTALDDERRGEPLAPLAPHALRAAYWKSAREGLDGDAIDLAESHASVPAIDLLGGLVDRIRPALQQVGDYEQRAGTFGSQPTKTHEAREGHAGAPFCRIYCGTNIPVKSAWRKA